MGTQSADDAGRELDPVWLGPKGIRWPFDWSIRRWIFFALTTAVVGLLFAFALPLALVLGVLVGWGGRSAGRLIDPDRPRRWMWVLVGVSLAFVLLLLPLHALALPMPFPFVPFAAVGTGLYATRLYGRLLDWNRPIGFYLRMPRLVAAGPRLRPEREVDPARLVLTAGPDADRRDLEPVRKIDTIDMSVTQVNGASLTSFRRTGSGTVPEITVTNTVAPIPIARPKKPRWIQAVPGGVRIGNTILDFTVKGS